MQNTSQDATTRALLACGAIGGPLFVLAFLLEGATRPGYNPLRYPISSLAIGPLGWTQAANFLITGGLIVAFAIGLRRALRSGPGAIWGPLLIGVAGVGLIGAGIFTTDPVFGYPENLPLRLAQFTSHGRMHDLVSMLVFLGLPAANLVLTRRFAVVRQTRWAVYSALTSIGMLVAFVLAGIGFVQTPGFLQSAGVYQRVSLIIALTWVTLLALRFLRAQPTPR